MAADNLSVFFSGATGCVGQAVLPQLLANGFAVTAFSRQPTAVNGCRSVVGSLENINRLDQEVSACDAILHLASLGSLEQRDTLCQDIAATAGLIEAWQRGPLVYASSAAVYGHAWERIAEDASVNLWHAGAACKYANELQLRLAERRGGRGGAVLLRPALIFAVNSRTNEGYVLSSVYRQCKTGARFVFGSEEGLAGYGSSYIGGADFGRVVVEALTRNLSSPCNVAGGFCTWRELIETINRVAGTKGDFVVRADTRPQAGEFRLPHIRTELDTTALEKATGFKPRETLEEIVEAFVRMEREQPTA